MSEPIVMTVLGQIPAEELGRTLAHEHCLIDLSVWFSAPTETSRKGDADRPIEMSMLADLRRRPFSTTRDNMILDDEELAIEELGYYVRAGGRSVIDVTCYGLGRDVRALQRISRGTGLNIVASTGVYVENAHPDWVADMDEDTLGEFMADEVLHGVAGTDVRCGLIGEIGLTGIPRGAGRTKVGPITPAEEKVLRGAARASAKTGVSVSVHTDPIDPHAALPAVDILEEEGVEPGRIIVGHMDQVQDVDFHLAVAQRGVFVEYDSLGREHYGEEWGFDFAWGHDSWRVRFVQRLVEEGHGGQVLLSHDVALKTDLRKYGGNGYAHVLDNIVPTLWSLGLSRETVESILVDNPRRAFSYVPREEPEAVGSAADQARVG
jgi:phosphotriesterase-related protein